MLDAFHVLSAQFQLIHVVTYVLGQMATDDKRSILTLGQMSVTGRLVDASNATLFATVTYGSQEISCIYKPVAGRDRCGIFLMERWQIANMLLFG